MTPKEMVVFGLWFVAAVLFFLVGFDIVNSTRFDLIALGLGCFVSGMIINTFVKSA